MKRYDVLRQIAAHIESTCLDGVSVTLAIDEARTKFSRLVVQLDSAAEKMGRLDDLHASPFYIDLMSIKANMDNGRYDLVPNQCRALAKAAQDQEGS